MYTHLLLLFTLLCLDRRPRNKITLKLGGLYEKVLEALHGGQEVGYAATQAIEVNGGVRVEVVSHEQSVLHTQSW